MSVTCAYFVVHCQALLDMKKAKEKQVSTFFFTPLRLKKTISIFTSAVASYWRAKQSNVFSKKGKVYMIWTNEEINKDRDRSR